MGRILVLVVIFKETIGLCLLFGFAEVYAFLLWVVRLFRFATVASDMGRALLAFLSTVLALSDGSALFGYKDELAVCEGDVSGCGATKAGRRGWRGWNYLCGCNRLLDGP